MNFLEHNSNEPGILLVLRKGYTTDCVFFAKGIVRLVFDLLQMNPARMLFSIAQR